MKQTHINISLNAYTKGPNAITYMHESTGSDAELVHNIQRNTHDHRHRHHPAEVQGPRRVLVLGAQHVVVAEQRKHEYNQQKHWADVRPADAPENARPVADHLLDVRGEVVDAVEPEHAGRFDEDNEQYGQPRSVHVDEVDQIDAALCVIQIMYN